MEQAQIVLDLFVPTDQDTAKAVHPTVRPFHHPSSGQGTKVGGKELLPIDLFSFGHEQAPLGHGERARSAWSSPAAL